MKAKLLKEQMGVPAGTELEVLETGRAWTLRAPYGAEIVVPACDLEVFGEPAPVAPETESYAGQTEFDDHLDMQLEESQRVHVFGSESAADFDRTLPDDDLDEPEPTEEEQDGQLAESVFPSDEEPLTDPLPDDDLDEPLPTPQDPCEGESCESCQ